MVPVNTVRAEGWDLRVARFAPSPNVAYAMFSGGGLAWAEAEMKGGAFLIEPAAPGSKPDLNGLSCRFAEIATKRGLVLSILVMPHPEADTAAFGALVAEVLVLAEGSEADRPLIDPGPEPVWPPAGFDLEARATRRAGVPLALNRAAVLIRTLAAHLVFKTGIRVGGFDPALYRRQLVENTDFRKFDDGLRLTIDCTPALADRIEARLAAAEARGIAHYGVHRQTSSLMTCFVPSAVRSDHVHFVDGGMGGYAAAAQMLKDRAAAAGA